MDMPTYVVRSAVNIPFGPPLIKCAFTLKGKNVYTELRTSVQLPIFAAVSDITRKQLRYFLGRAFFLDLRAHIVHAAAARQTSNYHQRESKT